MVKVLQRLGKSLMLPVSIMPAAAILKGIGYWIDPIDMGAHNVVAALLIESGGVIIDNLPFLFAIAIGIGMVKEKNSFVVISVVVSYMIVTHLLSPKCVSLFLQIPLSEVPIAFDHTSNALLGIIVGGINAFCYNHFSHIKFPAAFSFFNGKRLVPIICSLIMLVVCTVLLFLWPFLFNRFVIFGELVAKMGPIGAGLYGFFNRLLIPTGLHHALNAVFWFDVAGINDIGKFWGTVPGGIQGVTGMYQAGFFPIMMFGLPGAALAIYQCARDDKKKKIKGILISAAVASFFTGVTEPLEFSFMLVAPVLYFIHSVITGIMLFITSSFQWIAGFGFSAGFIDLVLSAKVPFSNQIYMLVLVGFLCFFLYYWLFKFCIIRYNLMTPGREADENIIEIPEEEYKTSLANKDYDDIAILLIEAMGGKNNIVYIENCVTRLHVEIIDMDLIQEQKILSTGVTGIIKLGRNNLQVIIGAEVEFIVNIMNEILT